MGSEPRVAAGGGLGSRATALERLEESVRDPFDVLVIGGGITGAGVALDAASRGLSVALVERADFASGTSGRSSRLIHGGARYLRHGELGLVNEALRERRVLMRLAPHLVRPLPFLVQLRHRLPRAAMRTGLALYDALAAGRSIAPHRSIGVEEVQRLAPPVESPHPGLVYWDCRTDDARLVIEIVRQAAAHGALLANRAGVEALLGDGEVRGARVRDRTTGETLDVRARITVNATGIWAAGVHRLSGADPPRLRPSKGAHVVLDRTRFPIRSALVVPARGDALIFMVPWGPRIVVGTTDTAYGGGLDDPSVDPDDTEVLLRAAGRAFGADLGQDDVIASWAGIRPLLDTRVGATRDLSRRHVILEEPRGLLTVTGGKLTTYRAMAEQVTDTACRSLGLGLRCRTRRIPLGMTKPFQDELVRASESATGLGLPPAVGRRLVERYGDDWEDVMASIRDDPSEAEPVVEGLPVVRAELRVARTREMALDDDDVLLRRTRLTTMAGEAALSGSEPTLRR